MEVIPGRTGVCRGDGIMLRFAAAVLILGLLGVIGYSGYVALCPEGPSTPATLEERQEVIPPASPYEEGCEIMVDVCSREGVRLVVIRQEGQIYRMFTNDDIHWSVE